MGRTRIVSQLSVAKAVHRPYTVIDLRYPIVMMTKFMATLEWLKEGSNRAEQIEEKPTR